MLQAKVLPKIKTHFYVKFFFLRKSYPLWDNVEKYEYGRAEQATDDNMAHAHCKLDKLDN